MSRTLGSRILRSAALVMASSVAAAAVGFLKNVLAAYYFGTSNIMDVYLLALLVPDVVMYLATTGSFTFIPIFAEAHARSEEEGWAAAGKMVAYWLLLIGVGVGIACVFAPQLTQVLAPGFDEAQRTQAVEISRVLLLMSGGVASARVFALVLYAQRKFFAPQVSEALFQVASAAYLVVFWRYGIAALVGGMVFGALVQLLAVAIGLWPQRNKVRVRLDLQDVSVRKMMKLIFPVYLSNAASKLNAVVNRAFASLLPAGAISSLQYSVMLAEAPITIVAASLTEAIFPFLSKQYAEKDDRKAHGHFDQALGAILVVFLPIAAGTFLIARPVVQLLLQRGSFDAQSTDLTSAALKIYALGILAMALNRILPTAFQARQNTSIPMQAGLVRILGNVAVCAVLVPRIGHIGVAVAVVVAEHMKLGVLFLRLRTGRAREGRDALLGTMARLLLAVGIMALVVSLTATHLLGGDLRWGIRGLFSLAAVVLLGAVTYGGALALLFPGSFSYYLSRALQEVPSRLRRRRRDPRFGGEDRPGRDRGDELGELTERVRPKIRAYVPEITGEVKLKWAGSREFESCRLHRLDVVGTGGASASLAAKVYRVGPRRSYNLDRAVRLQYESLQDAARVAADVPGVRALKALDAFADLGVLVTDWVDGRRLLDVLGTDAFGRRSCTLVRSCGSWLRRFHRLREAPPCDPEIRQKLEDVRQGLEQLRLEGVAEDLLRRVEAQVGRLAQALDGVPVPSCYSHRDFSVSNVMVDAAGSLVVLDIHRSQRPWPLDSDVASFLVSLEKAPLHPLRWALTPGRIQQLRSAFTAGYLGTPDEVSMLTRFQLLRMLVRTSCSYLRAYRQRPVQYRWLRSFFAGRLARALDAERRVEVAARAV
jgi:putative peptidoglycan lipid II flippase